MKTLNRVRLTRWIWIVLPVAIMLLFQRAIVGSIALVSRISGGIDPSVFFYLPFLSLLPPLVLFLIWYLRPARGHEAKLVITVRGKVVRDVGLGLGGAVLCVAVFIGSLKLLRALSLPTPDFSSLSWVHHLFFSTIGALVPGIAEEVYFRGFLMQKLGDLQPTLLIVMTSASFAFWHILSPPYLLHTFLVGLILGIIYYRTRRLLPVITAHTMANASAGVLFLLGYR